MMTQIKVRTTKPEAGNKYYNTKSNGGYSTCIKGKPTQKGLDVLANCVGNANAAFNEEHGFGYEKYHLNCNAENFIERAIASGLSVYKDPMVGGILVWRKGDTLSGSDGAGHVEAVIAILERDAAGHPTKIKTHSSGYGSSSVWWTVTRSNANGNWGSNSPYHYRATIAPEGYEPTPIIPITPTVARDKTKDQLETLEEMNIRTDIETTSPSLGTVPKGSIFNYYAEKKGKSSKWYAITEDKSQWIAGVSNNGKKKYCNIYVAEKPEPPKPEPTPGDEIKVGDTVKITASGYSNLYGKKGWKAWGIGWERTVLKIYDKDKYPYPYKVGKGNSVTGFYKESALKKK